ncbi:NAD(P)-binding protein [Coniophora puteana RWD-64-598 SS2]|uniref:NAD(P)-binding protein n=1 Tax=Coniophora puteana (strain RWD-64-598) TaxID=741705 RepID=A0A5M3MPC0_CONPW|nr:NAD(P)-binding protein [Coniophora puteana RWD-64-598 SS2]EIW81022.1 NAD(P)-binding protein [Coniophora puteana RWD-64-598 SS2]
MLRQSYPPKPKFKVEDIPDLAGQVHVVTGANTGVGKEIAKALLSKNAKVYIASRDRAKSEAAIEELKQATGKEAFFIQLNLSKLSDIKAAAEEFSSKESQLHVLYNNAGLMFPPISQLTEDGYDLQWGTNVLGTYYFTKLLLPTMLETAKTAPDGKVRVVTTASVVHYMVNGLNYNTFKDGPARKKMGTQKLYYQSKHGDVMLANELARRYGDQGLVSTSVNPGNLNTELARHLTSFRQWFLRTFISYPAPMGALTSLYCGTSPEGNQWNGRFFAPWARADQAHPATDDAKAGQELWSWLEEQVKDV